MTVRAATTGAIAPHAWARPWAQRRAFARLVAIAMVAVSTAGCGVTSDPQAREIPPNQLPFGLSETTTSSTTVVPSTTLPAATTVATTEAPTTTIATFTQTVYFVTAGRVKGVQRTVTQRPSEDTAVALLGAGPTTGEGDLTTLVTPGLVQGIARIGGTAFVTVAAVYDALDPLTQLLATAQLVFTLTELPGVGRVSYVEGGNPKPMWSPDGSQTAESISEDDYRAILAAP